VKHVPKDKLNHGMCNNLKAIQNMEFRPNPQAALARLADFKPSLYAKTRNCLDGEVTQLSPYITHGLVNIPTIVASLHKQSALTFNDKIIFEFAWREFFQHVWSIKGDAIFKDVNEAIYSGKYSASLPSDLAQGRTGVPAIDAAVRQLYATGYLHNHARMWLASYTIHIRKVYWRVGADWLYAHLLDGDCASNYLSWQWVAGTFSNKPYLFNAENIATYAKGQAHAHWHSFGTVVDQSYEALDAWARSSKQVDAEPGHHASVIVPSVGGVPDRCKSTLDLASQLRGRHVRLVHPWDLMDSADDCGPAAMVNVAWLCPDFHATMPWSSIRWDWVLERLKQMTPTMVVGDSGAVEQLLAHAQSVQVQLTNNAAYLISIQQLRVSLPRLKITRAPALLPSVGKLCNSFSKYYQSAQKLAGRLETCL
jgi:deoxyribodipyrimidine photo-lyase